MIFQFDAYSINAETFEAFRAGKPLKAEPQVLELLIFLLENRHRIVTKEEIFEVVWKDRIVADATLSSRIKAVRQLIGDDGAAQRMVRTVHGRGFRFVHEVTVDAGRANAADATQPPELSSQPMPAVHYARSEGVHIAYQLFGSGPVNLVFAPTFVSNIRGFWEFPPLSNWLMGLGRIARVAMFDKRGTGLSDAVADMPGMDQRMDDIRAVMDSCGFERAVLLGMGDGCPLTALFAASHPERCQGLILWGGFAQFTAWCPTPDVLEDWIHYIETEWGTGGTFTHSAPSVAVDPEMMRRLGKFEQIGASPAAAAALMRMNSEIDISAVLPAVHAPTLVLHRTGDALIAVEGGRDLASNIAGARLIEYPGRDHFPFIGDDRNVILSDIGNFLAELPGDTAADRTLATLLVARLEEPDGQEESGVAAKGRRDRMLRYALARYRGQEVELTDSRLVASFDGPARALRCAFAMTEELNRLGCAAGIGVHTGEVQSGNGRISGPALDIASHVAELMEGGVVASRTVKDLVAGSGIVFEEAGEYTLPGLPEPWRMYRITV